MAIAVAVGSSVFSPSMRTPSCNSNQDNCIPQFTSSPSSSSSSSSSSSPFRSRFLKEASGLRTSSEFSSTTASSRTTSAAAAASLKRKRPARLDIPQIESTACFGAVDEGKRCGGVDEVEADSTRFSVFCKKGKVKETMDDRYCAGVDIGGDSKLAFFGVFDGHGGSKAAEFAANNLEKNVIAAIREEGSSNQTRIEEAVRTAYRRTDSDLLKEEVPGGSCAVTALIMNDEDLIVSNAGDCRAVISKAGVAEALTSDHRPSREDEKNRIENNGGYVDCIRGVWRLQGTLAVSRGLGDSHLKQWVIADPETTVLKINPECEFLILASDGLWDGVSNQEAVDTVRSMWIKSSSNKAPPSLLSACNKLADLSVSRGSFDDVAVLVIPLRRFA